MKLVMGKLVSGEMFLGEIEVSFEEFNYTNEYRIVNPRVLVRRRSNIQTQPGRELPPGLVPYFEFDNAPLRGSLVAVITDKIPDGFEELYKREGLTRPGAGRH
jgi:hypothetical protein